MCGNGPVPPELPAADIQQRIPYRYLGPGFHLFGLMSDGRDDASREDCRKDAEVHIGRQELVGSERLRRRFIRLRNPNVTDLKSSRPLRSWYAAVRPSKREHPYQADIPRTVSSEKLGGSLRAMPNHTLTTSSSTKRDDQYCPVQLQVPYRLPT